MAQEQDQISKDLKQAWVYFGMFAFFIFAGIFVKRVLGHPEFMMAFHLPAAVFLVLSGRKFTTKMRQRYNKDLLEANKELIS